MDSLQATDEGLWIPARSDATISFSPPQQAGAGRDNASALDAVPEESAEGNGNKVAPRVRKGSHHVFSSNPEVTNAATQPFALWPQRSFPDGRYVWIALNE